MTQPDDTAPSTPVPAPESPIVIGAAIPPAESEPPIAEKHDALASFVGDLDNKVEDLANVLRSQDRRIALLESMIAPPPPVPPVKVPERKDEDPTPAAAAAPTCVHCGAPLAGGPLCPGCSLPVA